MRELPTKLIEFLLKIKEDSSAISWMKAESYQIIKFQKSLISNWKFEIHTKSQEQPSPIKKQPSPWCFCN